MLRLAVITHDKNLWFFDLSKTEFSLNENANFGWLRNFYVIGRLSSSSFTNNFQLREISFKSHWLEAKAFPWWICSLNFFIASENE